MNKAVVFLAVVALGVSIGALFNTQRTIVEHRPPDIGLSAAGLARAYVMHESQINEETVGKLTCVPQPINDWKVAVVCTERGPWGSDQIVLDLFRSTWQVAPSS